MLASIGVLMLLGGFTTFLLGVVKYFFPTLEKFMPEGFKSYLSIQNGVYVFLVGLLLVRFF